MAKTIEKLNPEFWAAHKAHKKVKVEVPKGTWKNFRDPVEEWLQAIVALDTRPKTRLDKEISNYIASETITRAQRLLIILHVRGALLLYSKEQEVLIKLLDHYKTNQDREALNEAFLDLVSSWLL